MLRQPVERSAPARIKPMPPPIKGWNAKKDIVDLDKDEAFLLDNWWPSASSIDVRRGSTSHITSMPAPTETLLPYSYGNTNELFAAAGPAIYPATTAGTVGAAVVTGLSNARWQHVNFGTSGGNFLFIVNGADDPRYYDGSSWTTPTITGSGYTGSDMIHVNVHKRRIFMIQKNSLNFWYLGVESIAGTANKFDLAPLCSEGGYLVAMGTWTLDGGNGIDDYAIFITSKGEVVVYQGTDPSDATKWSMVGTFQIAPPIGRRCFEKIGADLAVVTESGYYPISQALRDGKTGALRAASDNISGAVEKAAMQHKSTFGWQPILFGERSMFLVNVPDGNGKYVQHVLNTQTKAWTRFKDWDAYCWAIHNNELYYGGLTAIYKADTGYSDDGVAITAESRQAYYDMGTAQIKTMQHLRPIIKLPGTATVQYAFDMDYDSGTTLSSYTASGSRGTPWGSPWGSKWSSGPKITKDWLPVSGIGYNASLRLKCSVLNQSLSWRGADVQFINGGLM